MGRDETYEELMTQPQVTYIPPRAKRHRTKIKTPAATEATPAAIPKVYVRRTHSKTQKIHHGGNPTEVITMETSEEGSATEDEIQENVAEDKLANLASVAQ